MGASRAARSVRVFIVASGLTGAAACGADGEVPWQAAGDGGTPTTADDSGGGAGGAGRDGGVPPPGDVNPSDAWARRPRDDGEPPGDGEAPTDGTPSEDANPWRRPEAPPCPPPADATFASPQLLADDAGLVPWLAAKLPDPSIPSEAADVVAWQSLTREALRAGLGLDHVERPGTAVGASSLAPVQLGPVQAGRWLVEAHPGTWVPTLLLSPTPMPPGRLPAVLLQHGHNDPGKTRTAIFTLGVNLAARGCLVAMPDWPGYGDLSSPKWAHLLTAANLLSGRSMNQPITSIPRRVLDWLAALPVADPTRLAVAGHSGGGETAMYLGAADPRVLATVVVDGVDDWGWRLENGLVKDPEHYPIALLKHAGYADVLALVAPRWLTVVSGDTDDVAAPSVEVAKVVAHARAAWVALHQEDRLVHVGIDKGHQIGRAKREAVYQALATAFAAPELAGPEDGTLWEDAPALHIPTPVGNRSVLAMVRGWLDEAELQRHGRPRTELRGVVGHPGWQGATWLEDEAGGDGRLEGRVVRPGAPQIPVDLLQPTGAASAPRGALLCFADEGRAACSALGEQLAATGLVVATIDLRGQGELQGDWPHDLPNQRLRLAFLSAALGDPLPNQQLRDLFAVREALAPTLGKLPMGVVGLGPRSGFIAALAGAVDTDLVRVVAPGAVLDLRAFWDGATPKDAAPAESYPFGLLTAIDPTELPSLLGARALWIGAPWDGDGGDRARLCEALRSPWPGP